MLDCTHTYGVWTPNYQPAVPPWIFTPCCPMGMAISVPAAPTIKTNLLWCLLLALRQWEAFVRELATTVVRRSWR